MDNSKANKLCVEACQAATNAAGPGSPVGVIVMVLWADGDCTVSGMADSDESLKKIGEKVPPVLEAWIENATKQGSN